VKEERNSEWLNRVECPYCRGPGNEKGRLRSKRSQGAPIEKTSLPALGPHLKKKEERGDVVKKKKLEACSESSAYLQKRKK